MPIASSRSSIGFRTYPKGPCALAHFCVTGLPAAAMCTTGRSSSSRMRCAASIPSISPPSTIAMSTRSGRSWAATRSASSPLATLATTSYESLASARSISFAVAPSSSTTKMRFLGILRRTLRSLARGPVGDCCRCGAHTPQMLRDHVPAKRRAAVEVDGRLLRENVVEMLRRQAVAGPDRADVGGGEGLARLDVFDHEERAPKLAVLRFLRGHTIVDRPEGFLGGANGVDHGRELGRLERKRAVGPLDLAREREVF